MRKWMYNSVMSMPDREEWVGSRVMTTGAGEGDEPGDSPERPFLMIRFSTKDQPTRLPGSRVKQQRVQVWIHWEPGTMLPIDSIAAQLEKWLPTLTPDKTAEDAVIMDCHWEDTSGDGYDDHYRTSTRFVTFLVTYKDLT